MTCTNPGLDRWEAMVKIGDHSDLKPWEDGYADVKKQLGEWHIVVEGWEDTYASWLHDAQIKVEVGDDVENALESGAQLLERWAGARDSKLTADDKKTLREAAKTVADKSLDATARLAAATTDAIASLHETNPLRDGLSASNPQRFRVERPKSSFAAWYQFLPAFRRRVFRRRRQDRAGHAEDGAVRPRRARPKASTSCTCRRSSRLA